MDRELLQRTAASNDAMARLLRSATAGTDENDMRRKVQQHNDTASSDGTQRRESAAGRACAALALLCGSVGHCELP